MKEQNKQAPVVHNTFNAPIGQYVQYQHIEHMTIGSDGQIHVASSSQPTPQPTQTPATAELDPTPLIFLPNEQNQASIQETLKATLSISSKKSVICRELYKKRELFNLHKQDDTTKANIINAWIKKLNLTNNFRTLFTRKDFCSYYCKE